MEEEVLLNSNRAKTHKKIAYSTPSCANRKLRSPSRGNTKHDIKFIKSFELYNFLLVNSFLF